MKFKSQWRGRWWYFRTRGDADRFAEWVFNKTGVIVCIEENK